MSDNFYRAFEERHRGSRDLILGRLTAYRPFVAPLLQIYEKPTALDLGCGRGEWLEFLIGEGFAPTGVDMNEGMLSACLDRGLSASHGDAISTLAGADDGSLSIVSAFHLVEHITFDQLRDLVAEALRVLTPGGLLIMETPNPENIVVATHNFYLDPTHLRPIPPQLLSFLPEYYGFARAKVVRLQQAQELESRAHPSLTDVLVGVSPDYAVVAQKGAEAGIMRLLDSAFARDYGLSLEVLAARYDMGVSAAVERADAVVQQSVIQTQEAMSRTQLAEQEAQRAAEALRQMYASRSWKLTSPLRWVGWQIRLMKAHGAKARARALLQKVAGNAYVYLEARPVLMKMVATVSRRCGALPYLKALHSHIDRMSGHFTAQARTGPAGLTPRSQIVYQALKAARERKAREF